MSSRPSTPAVEPKSFVRTPTALSAQDHESSIRNRSKTTGTSLIGQNSSAVSLVSQTTTGTSVIGQNNSGSSLIGQNSLDIGAVNGEA